MHSPAALLQLVTSALWQRVTNTDACRHVERTSALVYVLDISRTREQLTAAERRKSHHAHADACTQYQQLVSELAAYNESILSRPAVVVLNKADCVPDPAALAEEFKECVGRAGLKCPHVVLTSAVEGSGLPALQDAMVKAINDEVLETAAGSTPAAELPGEHSPGL